MVKRRLLMLVFPAICAAALAAQDLNEELLDAVRKGDAPGVEALIVKGASVNTSWRYGETPLFFACDRGFTPVVKVLLEHGAEVIVADRFYGLTPVTRAAVNGRVGLGQVLRARGLE